MQVLVHVDEKDDRGRFSRSLLPRLPLDTLPPSPPKRPRPSRPPSSRRKSLEIADSAARFAAKKNDPARSSSPPHPAWPSARAVGPTVAALVDGRLPSVAPDLSPGRAAPRLTPPQGPLGAWHPHRRERHPGAPPPLTLHAASAPASLHSTARLRYPRDESPDHGASRAALGSLAATGVGEGREERESIARIEAMLQRELAGLNEHRSAGPSAPRLSVFRKAFEGVIGQFRFVGPTLAAIKAEYDAYLAALEAEKGRLLSLGAREAVAKYSAELERLRAEHRREAAELRAALKAARESEAEARRRCDEAEAAAEERLGEAQRAEANWREWRQANGALVSMVGHYERMFEEAEASRIKEAKEAEAAFRLAAESQAHVRTLLEEIERIKHMMEAAGKEVRAQAKEENKREIQRLHRLIGTTKLQLRAVETQYDELVLEHRETVEQVEALASTLREGALPVGAEGPELAARLGPLQAALGGIRGRLTPRPDWGAVKARAPALELGGDPPKPTAALLSDLLYLLEKAETKAALAASGAGEGPALEPAEAREEDASLSAAKDYVEGLGTGATVPRYLRWAGKVRNRKLSKRDTEALVRDCWSSKFVYDRSVRAAKGAQTPMADYFYIYLQKRFGIQAMIAEYGYSVVDALQRYSYDADVDLFRRVLAGELSEEVYADQLDMMERLRQMCIKLDRNQSGGKETGVVAKRTLVASLRKFFPLKADPDFRALLRALDGEQPGNEVVHYKLFQEDRNYNQGPFMELLRAQYIRDVQAYTAEVEAAILALPRDGEGKVTVAALREAMSALDPERPPKSMDEVLGRGLGPELADVGLLYAGTAVDPERFVRNLRQGILKKAVRLEPRAPAPDPKPGGGARPPASGPLAPLPGQGDEPDDE
eukprot:tig00001264_g7869.t1